MNKARVKIMPLSSTGVDVTIDRLVDGETVQETKHLALGDSMEVDLYGEDWAHIEAAPEDPDGPDARG